MVPSPIVIHHITVNAWGVCHCSIIAAFQVWKSKTIRSADWNDVTRLEQCAAGTRTSLSRWNVGSRFTLRALSGGASRRVHVVIVFIESTRVFAHSGTAGGVCHCSIIVAFQLWESNTICSADWNDVTRLEQCAAGTRTPLSRWNVGSRFTLRTLSGGASRRVHVVISVHLSQHASSHTDGTAGGVCHCSIIVAFQLWESNTICSADWNDVTRLEQCAAGTRTPLSPWNVGSRFTLRALSGGASRRVHVVISVHLSQHASSHTDGTAGGVCHCSIIVAFQLWESNTICSADWNDVTRLEQCAAGTRTPLSPWNVGSRFTLRALSGGASRRVHVVISVHLSQHASSHTDGTAGGVCLLLTNALHGGVINHAILFLSAETALAETVLKR